MAYEKPANPIRLPSTTYHAIPALPTQSPSSNDTNVPAGTGGIPSNAVVLDDGLTPVVLDDGITYVVLN